MIVTDEQVKSVEESCKMHSALKRSHLEANARIRELEAENLEQGIRWLDDVRKWISKTARATSRADCAKARIKELESMLKEYEKRFKQRPSYRTRAGGYRDTEDFLAYVGSLEARLRELVAATQLLINKVNRVTSAHRHGIVISKTDLDALSNRQIETEKALKEAKEE